MAEPSQKATDSTTRRRELNRRLRLAFILGAEEQWRRDLGRGLTEEEMRRIMRRYPGDLPER